MILMSSINPTLINFMLILVFAIAVIIMSHASKNIGKLMKSAFETVLRGSPQAKGFDRVLAKV